MKKLKLILCFLAIPFVNAYAQGQTSAIGTFSFSGFDGNKFSADFTIGVVRVRFFGEGKGLVAPAVGAGVVVSCSREDVSFWARALSETISMNATYRLKAYPGYAEFQIYSVHSVFGESLITKCHATQGPALYADNSGKGFFNAESSRED